MATMQKQVFSPTSYHFIFRITTALLAVFAAFQVKFTTDPSTIADQVATTISTSGLYAVIGIVVVSIAGPIWNAVQKKSFKLIWGSVSTYIYLGTALGSLLVLVGIEIPDGTAAAIVNAIMGQDWGGLGSVVTLNVLEPLVRFIISKTKKPQEIPANT